MTRVALYARYSSDQQREARIEDQLRLCRLHAEKQSWAVADSYHDRAESSASLIRPEIYTACAECQRTGSANEVGWLYRSWDAREQEGWPASLLKVDCRSPSGGKFAGFGEAKLNCCLRRGASPLSPTSFPSGKTFMATPLMQ
jgi:hypothetical protein